AWARLARLDQEVGAAAPPYPERFVPPFEAQAEAALAAAPAAFSVVFGVPDARVLAAFKDAGIVTLGTATTPDEAVALDEAGIDIVGGAGTQGGGGPGGVPGPGGGPPGGGAARGRRGPRGRGGRGGRAGGGAAAR